MHTLIQMAHDPSQMAAFVVGGFFGAIAGVFTGRWLAARIARGDARKAVSWVWDGAGWTRTGPGAGRKRR